MVYIKTSLVSPTFKLNEHPFSLISPFRKPNLCLFPSYIIAFPPHRAPFADRNLVARGAEAPRRHKQRRRRPHYQLGGSEGKAGGCPGPHRVPGVQHAPRSAPEKTRHDPGHVYVSLAFRFGQYLLFTILIYSCGCVLFSIKTMGHSFRCTITVNRIVYNLLLLQPLLSTCVSSAPTRSCLPGRRTPWSARASGRNHRPCSAGPSPARYLGGRSRR